MKIINLTPHVINILKSSPGAGYEEVMNVPPSGKIARLEVSRKETANYGGVVLYESVFGEPVLTKEGQEVEFPPKEEGIIYIVSSLFRSGFDRPDLYVPGELIRDANGQPVGCLGLSR